jgi:hypothetical protein
MIYLLSYKGRGPIVFPLVLVPVALSGAVNALLGKYFIVGFSLGFILIGILCWVLGRRWTAMGRDDRFCGGSVQTWGVIYGIFGALLLPAVINSIRGGF